MSPRTPEQFSEMREITKQKVMDVALELFANNGYYQSSISTITKKAGISKGLIYNYFESKEDLLKDIVFSGMDSLIQFFDTNQDGILTRDELLEFISNSITNIKENIVYWKLYFSLMVQPNVMKLFKNEMIAMIDPFFKMLYIYFESEGYDDPNAEVRFFQSLLDGVGLSYVSDPENYPIDSIENKIKSMYSKKF